MEHWLSWSCNSETHGEVSRVKTRLGHLPRSTSGTSTITGAEIPALQVASLAGETCNRHGVLCDEKAMAGRFEEAKRDWTACHGPGMGFQPKSFGSDSIARFDANKDTMSLCRTKEHMLVTS